MCGVKYTIGPGVKRQHRLSGNRGVFRVNAEALLVQLSIDADDMLDCGQTDCSSLMVTQQTELYCRLF